MRVALYAKVSTTYQHCEQPFRVTRPTLLNGLLFCYLWRATDSHTYADAHWRRYRYYVCRRSRRELGGVLRAAYGVTQVRQSRQVISRTAGKARKGARCSTNLKIHLPAGSASELSRSLDAGPQTSLGILGCPPMTCT
jgi:hypothetical protein